MNYKVVIDPGHGGEDPGAINGNIYEKNFNLEVSRYMYDRFRELGVPVTMTRDSDVTLPRDERVNTILNAYGNSPDVIVLSNHINAGGGEGAEIVYALRNNNVLAKNVLESIGAEGQIMRKYYQRRLPEDTSKDYYFIHRLTGNTQPLLIEYGFIDNARDLNKLQKNLLQYGEAVVRAVANYIGVPYSAPTNGAGDYYTVKSGDTLYSIANRFGVSVNELKQNNNLTSNLLTTGQTLLIPKKGGPTPGEGAENTYTVKSGDSLWKIANEYGVTVNDIIALNNLPTTSLTIGQKLIIPSTNTSIDIVEYIVKSGDSLWKIANEYGVTVNDIMRASDLTSTVLKIGQVLNIPTGTTVTEPEPGPGPTEPEVGITQYTVRSGDSLWKIANEYGVTVNDIIEANNLTSTSLTVGQLLNIPMGTTVTEPEPGPGPTEPEVGMIEYTVKSGDSIYSIAKKYNVTVDQLRVINNLSSNLISVGQVLKIPTEQGYVTYSVKNGDSLYSIAKKFNTTPAAIREMNGLSSDLLRVGQNLIIPQ